MEVPISARDVDKTLTRAPYRKGPGESGPLSPGQTAHGLWRSLVSALDWGSRGPGFKSRQPDLLTRDFLGRFVPGEPSRSPVSAILLPDGSEQLRSEPLPSRSASAARGGRAAAAHGLTHFAPPNPKGHFSHEEEAHRPHVGPGWPDRRPLPSPRSNTRDDQHRAETWQINESDARTLGTAATTKPKPKAAPTRAVTESAEVNGAAAALNDTDARNSFLARRLAADVERAESKIAEAEAHPEAHPDGPMSSLSIQDLEALAAARFG